MKSNLNVRENGSFTLEHADAYSYLYFPLTNYKGMKSSITPKLGGDAKVDQNRFLLTPVTNEDFHNSFLNRNLYFKVNDDYVWSITGNTPYQMLHKDDVTLEADLLIHKIIRSNQEIECTIESFVPFEDGYQELHKVTFQNKSGALMKVKPVVSIPLYSRSADNIRDHRHVTSLLNKATIRDFGIVNKPTFTFDERGHHINTNNYGVFVKTDGQTSIKNYWPILEELIGEGGKLLDPEVVREDFESSHSVGDHVSGFELTGGFEFHPVNLKSEEEISFLISIATDKDGSSENDFKSLTFESFEVRKEATKNAWDKELSTLQFSFADKQMNGWLKWVTLQPILRRIYGCSFLPHHDYGRGGRGWRDLWQDSLALILMNPQEVRSMLLNNFLGVRIDGSNATIIGDNPGEFKADRNNIAKVWMDHGSWPFITTMLYVNKSGDYPFLLAPQKYFKDKFHHYTKQVDSGFESRDPIQKNATGKDYEGTILEHLILENVIPFYNVGEHNNIRIEGADWNDALDMASAKGESVAFTALYASNLIELGETLMKLFDKGIKEIELLKEMDILFSNVDYKDPNAKQTLLGT
ncbi:MAG: cellobiose phosphorylase, partial [Bacilli bacterium]|nr:cellobiose phosphorylase [Bacilli bacterium]